MNQNIFDRLGGVVVWLLASSLAGCCATPAPEANVVTTPSQGMNAMQSSARAIISFQRPTLDNPKLNAAIAEACQCQPVFFRSYPGDDKLIYVMTFPLSQSFSIFSETLMRSADQFGIKAVEQDSLMQHQ